MLPGKIKVEFRHLVESRNSLLSKLNTQLGIYLRVNVVQRTSYERRDLSSLFTFEQLFQKIQTYIINNFGQRYTDRVGIKRISNLLLRHICLMNNTIYLNKINQGVSNRVQILSLFQQSHCEEVGQQQVSSIIQTYLQDLAMYCTIYNGRRSAMVEWSERCLRQIKRRVIERRGSDAGAGNPILSHYQTFDR